MFEISNACLAERAADEQVSLTRAYLREGRRGHERTFEIDPISSRTAECSDLIETAKPAPVQNMQSSGAGDQTGGTDKGS